MIEITEPYSAKMINSAIHEADITCREQNLNKVLVDMRNMPGDPSLLDRHLHGIEVAKIWGSRIKAALVLRTERLSHMTENTAVNRGANVLSTSDFARAMEWLEIENQ